MPEETATFEHFQIARREDGSLFELGRGAMGVTYKAYDTRLDGYVALKVINPGYLNDETGRERFLREARAAAHLDHPNVAAIFHRGQEGGNYFYAMQFIEGETVDAFVRRRGSLPTALALRIVLQAAQGLAAANARGLIHRDIKPANLMLVNLDGTGTASGATDANDEDLLVKVIDFGLAKVVLGDKDGSELSLTGEGPIGTPYYMSPEQIDSSVGEVDARTDIYSLGVTLWYLLTGQPPFVGTQFQVFRQHISASPPTARLPGGVPESVRALLDRMMAKSPTDRPANTRDLITSLRELLRGPLASSTDNAATLPVPPAVDYTPPPPTPYPSALSSTPYPPPPPVPVANPADSYRPPPPPYPPAAYQTPPPPPVAGNSGSTYPPPPTPGNSGSVFPPGPYQPPPVPAKPHGREWMIFGGVLLGALLLGGIPLGIYVAKLKREKLAKNDTSPPASVTPAPTTPPPPPSSVTPPPSVPPSPGPSRNSSAIDAASASPDSNTQFFGIRTLTVPGQYSTIQAAINAAKTGDTVKVSGGIYREKLVFKDGIRLVGAGVDETIVSTPGDGECLEAKNCASGSVVGFTFEHTGANKANEVSYIVWLHGSTIRLRNCRFRNSGSVGVGCEDGDKSIIEDCEVVGSHNLGLRALGAGTAPTFRNNRAHGNLGTGISFTKGASGTAENNVSEDNVEFGFSIIDAGTAPTLSGNTVRNNKMSGFTYQTGSGGTAQDNTVENNKEGGFRLADKGTSPKISQNRIKGSGLSGFIIVAGAGGTIDNNTSEENTGSGILVNGAGTAPTITNNKLTNNKIAGIYYADGSAGMAQANVISGNVNGVDVNGKGTAPTLRENQIRNSNSDGIAVRDGAGGALEGNICESNGQYGIAVYGVGTSPMLSANKTEKNKKENNYVEKGATPKRSAKYDSFFQ